MEEGRNGRPKTALRKAKAMTMAKNEEPMSRLLFVISLWTRRGLEIVCRFSIQLLLTKKNKNPRQFWETME